MPTILHRCTISSITSGIHTTLVPQTFDWVTRRWYVCDNCMTAGDRWALASMSCWAQWLSEFSCCLCVTTSSWWLCTHQHILNHKLTFITQLQFGLNLFCSFVIAALRSRCGHYIFALWFLLSFFISSPNLSGLRVDVYHTCTHGVALVQI